MLALHVNNSLEVNNIKCKWNVNANGKGSDNPQGSGTFMSSTNY